MFLNVVRRRLKPKDLTIIAVETKAICKFISFRTTGCYVQVLSNTVEKQVEKTITELRQRAQNPLLIEERTAYASVWIDFGLEMRGLTMRGSGFSESPC